MERSQMLQRRIAKFVLVTHTLLGVSMNAFRADWENFRIREQHYASRASLDMLLTKQVCNVSRVIQECFDPTKMNSVQNAPKDALRGTPELHFATDVRPGRIQTKTRQLARPVQEIHFRLEEPARARLVPIKRLQIQVRANV